ncbi:MAG: PilZ domain-containing protein [Candidatus Koribacter versatilis]|uniref:PilZ domain-containing protein n=1 Tax=Candidatus Korobacter versatilis TaxID=658062 RepID=A0A932A9A2_9BACT|nr:PilZ domain-containing protein [Candidatus Koribacter versatilis]
MRFRLAGHDAWQTAKTRNLSSSGVLFRSRHLLSAGTMVDLEIELNEGFPVTASHVRARGAVVRQLKDESGAQDGWFVAVRYEEYRLERQPQVKFPAPLPARLPFTPLPSHR